jgi:hypothetical protein
LPIGEFFRDALIQALSCAYEPRWVAARRYPWVTAAVVAAAAGLADAAWGQDRGLASAAESSVRILFFVGTILSLPSPADVDLGTLPRWRAWVGRFPWRYAGLVAATGAIKGFHQPAAQAIFGQTRLDGFAFDVEVLVLARRLGLVVAQVPVQAQQRAGSTVHLLGDSRRMLSEVWALRRTAATDHDEALQPALPAASATATTTPAQSLH